MPLNPKAMPERLCKMLTERGIKHWYFWDEGEWVILINRGLKGTLMINKKSLICEQHWMDLPVIK